jgi:hypothetical protein
MTDFLQTLDERSDGIGAQDRRHVLQDANDDRSYPDLGQGASGPIFDRQSNTYSARAGVWYSLAIRMANYHRTQAFYALPDFGEPRGTAVNYHPSHDGATKAELRLGCPAWPL